MKMIKSMVLENSIGRTEGVIEVFGQMENNMVEEFIGEAMGLKEKGIGMMGESLNGQMNDISLYLFINHEKIKIVYVN